LSFALVALLATAAPTHAAAARPRLDGAERALVRAINGVRAQHGLRALRASARLSRAADRHSADMLRHDFFGHASSRGATVERRLWRFRQVGEALAYTSPLRGIGLARRVLDMWLGSPPHRAILLSPAFRRVGIGRRTGRLGAARVTMVTADFASRR
jgi:uncharacterized protein YkwD